MIQNQNMSIDGFLAEYVNHDDLPSQGTLPILVEENRFRRMREIGKNTIFRGGSP